MPYSPWPPVPEKAISAVLERVSSAFQPAQLLSVLLPALAGASGPRAAPLAGALLRSLPCGPEGAEALFSVWEKHLSEGVASRPKVRWCSCRWGGCANPICRRWMSIPSGCCIHDPAGHCIPLVFYIVAPVVPQADVDLMSEVVQLSSMREPMRQQAYRQLCAQLLKLQHVRDEGGQGSRDEFARMLVSLQGQSGPQVIIIGHHHGVKWGYGR